MENIKNRKTFAVVFGWGVLATVGMSILMIIAKETGISPMPKPIPLAIIGKILGKQSPMPLLMILGIICHLGYGGIWAIILSSVAKPVTVYKGIILGVILWLIMQLIVLPFLGWGIFGIAITPKIAIATLVLHLVYGSILGWSLSRRNIVSNQDKIHQTV